MTRQEQHEFVTELIQSITLDIVKKVPRFPAEWTGHQIRQYIADTFNSQCVWDAYRLKGADLKAYRNDVAVNNL